MSLDALTLPNSTMTVRLGQVFPLSAGQDATGPAGDGDPVNSGDMSGKRHVQVIDQKPRNVLQRLGDRGAVGGV